MFNKKTKRNSEYTLSLYSIKTYVFEDEIKLSHSKRVRALYTIFYNSIGQPEMPSCRSSYFLVSLMYI